MVWWVMIQKNLTIFLRIEFKGLGTTKMNTIVWVYLTYFEPAIVEEEL